MAIYYVRTDGSDSNDGLTNSAGGAWQTSRFASRSLSPGDTLRYVHTSGGSETEYVETAGAAIDWSTAPAGGFGTSWASDQRIRIEANPGDEGKIILKRDTAGGTAVVDMRATSATLNVQFVEFYNLIFDGAKNSAAGAKTYVPIYKNASPRTDNTVHDVRFYGCEARNSSQSSGLLQESTTTAGAGIPHNLLFTKDPTTGRWGKLTNNGTTTAQHGIYMQGRDNEVAYTEVSGSAGLGVQVHRDTPGADNCNDIYLHHLLVHDNGQTGIYYGGSGERGRVHNCLVYDNATHGIRFDDGATDGEALNCTSVRNTTANFTTGATAAVTGTKFKNCIARKLGVTANNFSDNGQTVEITACTNIAVTDTDAIDPQFVDPSTDNFHLKSNSPCISAGADLSAEGITDDLDGKPRLGLWDQGAFDFSAEPVGAFGGGGFAAWGETPWGAVEEVASGETTLTPSAVAAVYAVATPSLLLGGVTKTPGAVAAAYTVATPSVSQGSGVLTPAAAAAAYSVIAPALVKGAVTITPGALSGSFVVATPSLLKGALILTSNPVTGAWSVQVPVVTRGGIILAPSPVVAVWTVTASSIIKGTRTLLPVPVGASWVVVTPVVEGGTPAASPADPSPWRYPPMGVFGAGSGAFGSIILLLMAGNQ